MEFFTTAAGTTVHVWDTKDERCPIKSGMTHPVTPGLTGGLPVLVLLHGYLETMYIFNELIETLKNRYRIIALDLPGHGLSDSAPADDRGQRINTLAFCAAVVAGVLDKCGVERAWIAGHSMGGYVAQQFLADHPDRTEGVILLCSHPYPDTPEKATDREKEKQLVRAGKLQQLAALSIPKMYDGENLRACDEKIRETIELCETHDPEGICSSIDGLRLRPDLSPVLAGARRPVLLVHGDGDAFLPAERVEAMRTAFPKLQVAAIAQAGHNAFIERQDAVEKEIQAFTTESYQTDNVPRESPPPSCKDRCEAFRPPCAPSPKEKYTAYAPGKSRNS